MEEINLRMFSRKLLTCYQPDNLKTLCFDPDPKGGQILNLWPTGWRSHLDQQMLIFHSKYWCLSSRPPVSCRRDESKCHQVLVFPDQDERRLPARTFRGRLPNPLEPLIASSVWGMLHCQPTDTSRRVANDPIDDHVSQILLSLFFT